LVGFDDFILNLSTEIIGIIITVFLVDRLIVRHENKRRKPLQNKVYSRISELLVILSAWLQGLSLEGNHDILEGLVVSIKNNKKALLDIALTGESVISDEIKQQLIELDNKLEFLLNYSLLETKLKKPSSTWIKKVNETINQLALVAQLIGADGVMLTNEAWLDALKESGNSSGKEPTDNKA
jgi:hypothetical protein